MKKIGLVGGIGPASTVEYYLGLIEKCRKEFGNDTYPEIVIDSVNMSEATEYIAKENYEQSARLMLKSICNLKAAGAQIAAITANTEHIVWKKMKNDFAIPVVSIVDATVNEILRAGYKKVLVLGTVFTMKSGLYEHALSSAEIVPIIPSDADKEIIGNLIYPNLENGIVIPADKEKMISLAEKYIAAHNADAVLLACTELPLMIKTGDLSASTLNTTQIHIDAIFAKAVE